jgi:hypothetical protein
MCELSRYSFRQNLIPYTNCASSCVDFEPTRIAWVQAWINNKLDNSIAESVGYHFWKQAISYIPHNIEYRHISVIGAKVRAVLLSGTHNGLIL